MLYFLRQWRRPPLIFAMKDTFTRMGNLCERACVNIRFSLLESPSRPQNEGAYALREFQSTLKMAQYNSIYLQDALNFERFSILMLLR